MSRPPSRPKSPSRDARDTGKGNRTEDVIEPPQAPKFEQGTIESILDLEDEFQREGAEMAKREGALSGAEDGYSLGWTSGSSVNAELCFYAGVSAALDTMELSSRGRSAADALRAIVHRVKLHEIGNDESTDFSDHLTEARNAFRSAAALGGLPRLRFDADKPSRTSDLSF